MLLTRKSNIDNKNFGTNSHRTFGFVTGKGTGSPISWGVLQRILCTKESEDNAFLGLNSNHCPSRGYWCRWFCRLDSIHEKTWLICLCRLVDSQFCIRIPFRIENHICSMQFCDISRVRIEPCAWAVTSQSQTKLNLLCSVLFSLQQEI